MNSCGIIVEYNPFHNGHQYHIMKSKEESQADCVIAVMSGQFLQRGEPAIIDKWHRSRAALQSGVDLVVELPYLFAVQHSDYFSKGAVLTLDALGVNSICFGSENGSISPFLESYDHLSQNATLYEKSLRESLNEGNSYPEAARTANEAIGISTSNFDFSAPNNILGYSYVKQIFNYAPSIEPLTVERKESQYHDSTISGQMASATSIRKEILNNNQITEQAASTLPDATIEELISYYNQTHLWHEWDKYFDLLHYKLSTISLADLKEIHGVDEGLEYRLKQAIKSSTSFMDFMERIKTKRYTWTRLQRTCTHILVGLTKTEATKHLNTNSAPYVRILGMNHIGQRYLSEYKKKMTVPLITQPQQLTHSLLDIEEKSTAAYYSPLSAKQRVHQYHNEFGPPLRILQ
ncbi:nucleotidyltransferase [Halobacillus seohaensis]|uniref:tRNA(Met) cytidine acetate ligase n=1 Tax=Halobacillus seohaensis TaxID=447421 RepID=A0ABW2EJZ8_9BACI